jgi:hypothetical protein
MNVAELIAELQDLDPTLHVVLGMDDSYGFCSTLKPITVYESEEGMISPDESQTFSEPLTVLLLDF